MANMIFTHKIASTGVRRLREEIENQTGNKYLYTARAEDFNKPQHFVLFRYGNSAPVPAEKDTIFNTAEEIKFLCDKLAFANRVLELGFIAPKLTQFDEEYPTENDFPLIVRETLTSYGGKGMHLFLTQEEYRTALPLLRLSWYWCPYIETSKEFRFHILNPRGALSEAGPQIIRVMEKVPRTEEIAERPAHIRHVDEYHYSKRYDPTEKFPRWSEQIISLVSQLPGWLYSLDVGVTPDKRLVFFEANTASGIDNGCAGDYAKVLIPELGL